MKSFMRVTRAFAEASLVALGFATGILLLGTPVALVVRGVYEGLAWLARGGGEMSPAVHALVLVASVAAGVVVAVVSVRLLVGFFDWRRSRARTLNGSALGRRRDREDMARAA